MKRIVPGFALAAFWILLLLSGSFTLFWLAMCCISLVASLEYVKMALSQESSVLGQASLAIILTLPVLMAGLWHEDGMGGGLFLALFLCVCYLLSHYADFEDGFGVLAKLIFGALFVGFFSAHLVLLRLLPEGDIWLIILVAITAGSDSGAYYCGRKWGRRKLCRHISPNKTVEGALGGLVCGVAAAVIIAFFFLESVNWSVLLPVTLILTGAGILGDLTESIVKRGTGAKDSGRLLLGHGGVLDRIDSLLVAGPILYYLQILTLS